MTSLFERLEGINRKPKPFEFYTARELWTDPHTSARMLECHLNPEVDLSSRKAAFIERSAAWIAKRFRLDAGVRVIDFGCGPGLYASAFAESGACVTGVDFSERSLAYAKENARARGLKIDYIHGDYLAFKSEARARLATMIMCDFCALSPAQRRRILTVFHDSLEPGGHVLLDAYSLAAYSAREEIASYAPNLLNGFWSARPYYGFLNTFKYDDEKVVLDKYTIIEKARVREVYNWLQYFSEAAISAEFDACGFEIEAFLGDVAGGAYAQENPEFAVVARKK